MNPCKFTSESSPARIHSIYMIWLGCRNWYAKRHTVIILCNTNSWNFDSIVLLFCNSVFSSIPNLVPYQKRSFSVYFVTTNSRNNLQEKEQPHRCFTLVFEKLFVAAAAILTICQASPCFFCSSVCIQYNTRKWKSSKKQGYNSASMYCTECKLKNKNGRDLGTRL